MATWNSFVPPTYSGTDHKITNIGIAFIEFTERVFDRIKYCPDRELLFEPDLSYCIDKEETTKKILLNPNYLKYIHPSDDNRGTTIFTNSSAVIFVRESYDEVKDKLKWFMNLEPIMVATNEL